MPEVNPLDFFSGGVPAGVIYQIAATEIKKLLQAAVPRQYGQTLEAVCFIGLVSYFEAFFRDCFASIVNIAPGLLERLNKASFETRIDSLAAIRMGERIEYQIGFMVSEKLDFGSAKKVNSLYSTLIRVTPFSTADQKAYDALLADRNLLVHHAGLFTEGYIRQHGHADAYPTRTYYDSLNLTKEYVEERYSFLNSIGSKTVIACKRALMRESKGRSIILSKHAKKALKLFGYWDEGA